MEDLVPPNFFCGGPMPPGPPCSATLNRLHICTSYPVSGGGGVLVRYNWDSIGWDACQKFPKMTLKRYLTYTKVSMIVQGFIPKKYPKMILFVFNLFGTKTSKWWGLGGEFSSCTNFFFCLHMVYEFFFARARIFLLNFVPCTHFFIFSTPITFLMVDP